MEIKNGVKVSKEELAVIKLELDQRKISEEDLLLVYCVAAQCVSAVVRALEIPKGYSDLIDYVEFINNDGEKIYAGIVKKIN